MRTRFGSARLDRWASTPSSGRNPRCVLSLLLSESVRRGCGFRKQGKKMKLSRSSRKEKAMRGETQAKRVDGDETRRDVSSAPHTRARVRGLILAVHRTRTRVERKILRRHGRSDGQSGAAPLAHGLFLALPYPFCNGRLCYLQCLRVRAYML